MSTSPESVKAVAPDAPGVESRWLERVRTDSGRFIALLCLSYLAIETLYVLHLPLVMDEFQGAAAVDRLSHELPYRDYRPYKTVVGYYLQWPVLLLGKAFGLDLWARMIAVKLTTALATTIVLAVAARRLRRHFDPAAVVLGLSLLVSMSTFLERSAALRVDMLTALFGLCSLLALLDGRAWRAGLLAGVSFLASQKGIYYALAGAAGLGLDWTLAGRERERLLRGLRFGLASAFPVALYFGGFGLLASATSTATGIVSNPTRIAFGDFYDMDHFWIQTLVRNPGFWAAVIAGLAVLLRRRRDARDRVLLGYGVALMALCVWHKQPWPYFFVLLLPTGFVLATRWLDGELRTLEERGGSALRLALVLYVAVGLLVPLSRIPTVLARDNGAQRATVALAAGLLEPADQYLGGLDFVYTHRQVPGLSWLDGPRLSALEAHDDTELAELERSFVESRPRLVIWNYRIARLPDRLRERVRRTHAPLFGNLLIYSPSLAAGPLALWFEGRYALSGPAGGSIVINGRLLAVAEELWLKTGPHVIEAEPGYRLHLIPDDIESRVAAIDPALARPQPLFEAPYRY